MKKTTIGVVVLTIGLFLMGSCQFMPPSSEGELEGDRFASMALPSGFKIVGYSTTWSGTVSEIQFDKLTHVNYAFVVPNDSGDGNLQPLENPSKLRDLVQAAHARGVKVLIAVGGWNNGNDQGFERLASSSSTIRTFVNNMISMCNTYDLDGVDIDWEYPDPWGSSAQNYANLMRELDSELHGRGLLLTAAVCALGSNADGVLGEVFNYVDFLNIMAYDGGDGPAHSPYSYAVDAMNYWHGRGLSKSKAILGVPFYGRPTWAAYRTLVANDPQAPYKDTTYYSGVTVHYNGIPTMQDKTNLALQQGNGVMMWELAQDTTDATSLLRTIYETASGQQPSPTPTPTFTPTPTPTPTPGVNEWQPWIYYSVGTVVTYQGPRYRCRQSHTSQPDWTPPQTLALWLPL